MQKVLTSIVVGALFLTGPSLGAAQSLRDYIGQTFEARVIGIVDGDTIDVLNSNSKRPMRVRLDGIDTPEQGEPFSRQAKNLTRVLAFDQQVRVIGKDVDRYQRLVARVMSSGKDLSVSIVALGLACHFLRYSSDPALAAAERTAKSAGLGFWAPGAAKPRCVALNQTPSTASAILAEGFFGNTNSRVYHSAACKNAHCKNCTRRFRDKREAERAGFTPARDCIHE